MFLRVLHFLDTEQFAGTEQHLLTLCKHLSLLGVECGLLCRSTNTDFVEKARDIPALYVTVCDGKNKQMLVSLHALMSEWKPNIVHAHNGRTSLMAARLGRTTAKRVFTQHFVKPAHTEYRGIKRFAAMAVHGMVNARTDKVIAVSEAARQAMIEREHLPESKIVTIWNGIEKPNVRPEYARQILGQDGFERKPLFVTIARLAHEKGYLTLLEAVPMVLRQFPDAGFVWIGGGELEQELTLRIEQKGLQNSVQMQGYQSNAVDYLGVADALILPSDCEPFGLVLVEAMMCGVPVIGTNCGGAKEIVSPHVEHIAKDQAVGWLVPPRNPQALAEAIMDAISHPESTRMIAHNGQERARQHFTAERMARQTLDVYEELLR